MCTLVVLRQPNDLKWPVLAAANRDELKGRAWQKPGRHWPDRPDVIAGLDQIAEGSWMGVNDNGVMAAILNRRGTLGPMEGKRSRGELVLEALDHADAGTAAEALGHLEPAAYRPFNLIIVDNRDAIWLRHSGNGSIECSTLDAGLSMIAAGELNDPSSARIRRYRPLFRESGIPVPECSEWTDWQLLMASTSSETGDPRDAMCIQTSGEYGTSSSSLIALPAQITSKPRWLFAAGPPNRVNFEPVEF